MTDVTESTYFQQMRMNDISGAGMIMGGAMKASEVARLIQFAAANGTRIPVTDEKATVQAWWMSLDVRLTLDNAIAFAAQAAAEGDRVTPGTINHRFLAAIRDPAQQGYGRPRLPVRPQIEAHKPKRIMPDIGVKSTEVPEYQQAMQAHRTKERAHACSYCGAEVGQPCVDGLDRPMKGLHPNRSTGEHVQRRQRIKQKAVSAP